MTTSLNTLINQNQSLLNKVCCLEQRLADLTEVVDGHTATLPADAPPATGTSAWVVVEGVPQYDPA